MLQKLTTAFVIALSVQCSSAASAGEILVLGDSWGVGIGPSVTSVAGNAGYTVDNQAQGGREAADMVTPAGLAELTSDLSANPDAKVVHLIIGGNDFLAAFGNPSSFNSIISNIETIANHITTIRPDVQTFHMGYEYPQPLGGPFGSVANVNQNILTLSGMQEAIVAPNYNYIEFYGLTQEVFGAGVNDPSLPGDAAAFSDSIHLNQAGYLLYAQASFDSYSVHLVPEPTSGVALLMASIGMVGFRRRR